MSIPDNTEKPPYRPPYQDYLDSIPKMSGDYLVFEYRDKIEAKMKLGELTMANDNQMLKTIVCLKALQDELLKRLM